MYKIVSIIFAFSAITIIPLANPIIIAGPIISFAPSINACAISSGDKFPSIPLITPTAKNTAAISGIQNPFSRTPHTITPIAMAKANNIIL